MNRNKKSYDDRSHGIWPKFTIFGLLFLSQLGIFWLAGNYVKEYVGFMLTLIPFIEFFAFIYIINDSSNPMYKLAWVFLILSMPFFGIFIYLLATFDVKQKKMRQRFSTMKNRYQPLYQGLGDPGIKEEIRAQDPLVARTITYLEKTGNFPVYRAQDVIYHEDGAVHFDDMLEELKKAEKFIFLEYFILSDGFMWQTILEILKEKVKKGVEVRILIDGMQAFINLPVEFPLMMREEGIDVRLFSPMKPILSFYQNHRDHRKIMVIDGEVAYTGGLNIADEYINKKERFGYWKDTAVKVTGNAVDSFTLMFLEVWNALEGGQLEEKYLRRTFSKARNQGYVIPYFDMPSYDGETKGKQVYLDIINQARDYIYIMTPYLIIDYEILSSLQYAARSGVDVKIILPHIPDKPWVFYTTRTFYRELLEAGAQVYEYLPGFLHAKTFVSDSIKAVVGTINMDYRSFYLQLECGAYFYKTPVSQELERDFLETLELSKLITMETVDKFPFHQRVIGRLMRLIAPLL
ncbi:MAG: cardiolipin synthase [Tissierellia bacterium]|nr:cardiolipin synthase [Tissierellia bacterium]